MTDPRSHAVRIILKKYSTEVSRRIGRPPTSADLAKPIGCVHVGTMPDLDGDGVDETTVTEGCSWGMYGSLHILYFSSHGCLRYADDLVAGELEPRGEVHSGVRDLEARWSNGCAGNDFVWTQYRWNGAGYRVFDSATCELCPSRSTPLPPAANRHPYCQAELRKRP